MLETIMKKKKIHRNFSMKLFFRIQEKKTDENKSQVH
jgi:hypothetical protein